MCDFSTHLHSTLFGLSRVVWSVKVLFYLFYLSLSFFRKNVCAENPCANNATCRSSFTDQLYQYPFLARYKGPKCQTGKQKIPLYRSGEIFNSIIKKHSSRKAHSKQRMNSQIYEIRQLFNDKREE